MPRSQANLKLTFLRGLKGRTHEEKLLYVALLLEPSLTPCGVGVYRLDWWGKEAELKPDEAEQAMAGLEENRFAYADTETGEVLVRTLIRRDGIAEKPNMLWAACRAAKLIQSEKLRRVVADELRKLPPKPAPTMAKNDKLYQYPDPHATADEIDPRGPSDPTREPIPNGSTTYPEPIQDPGDGEYIPIHSRTTGGGGGGSFSSSPSEPKQLSVCDTHERTAPRRRTDRVSPADLNATAAKPTTWALVEQWRAAHEIKYSPSCYRKIAAKIRDLPPTARPDVLREMLRLYDVHPKASPGLIPFLYDDAVKVCRGLRPAPTADPDAALSDLRARGAANEAARLIHALWFEPSQPPGDPTPPDEWMRAKRVAWIDQHAEQIRSALTRREAS